MLFWLDASHFLYGKGFRVFYGRASNVRSFKLLTSNGGTQTAILSSKEYGKELTLSFVRWPMDPISKVCHIAEKYKNKAKL